MADVMAWNYSDFNMCCKELLKQRTIADVEQELFRFAKEKGTVLEEKNGGEKRWERS